MSISAESYAALQERRSNIIARINAWSFGDVGDKPDANQPGKVEHVAYKKSLYAELEDIERLLASYDASLNGGGEVLSEGRT